MARKGILNSAGAEGAKPRASAPKPAAKHAAPRGAVGALQSSLMKLQENTVQEIDPHMIHAAGVSDRLGVDEGDDRRLLESLREYGQQVPILVRPRTGQPGHYDIVYGRRRVLAMRDLGLPIKAMIRQLDDKELVLAQGQENTARQDLSFIEKASFAAQLDALDYDRPTIAAALSMDLPMVSRMLKVGRAFTVEFLQEIGSAPGIGRDRWLKLVEAMDDEATRARVEARLPALAVVAGSDTRFEEVLAWAQGTPPPKAPRAPGGASRKVVSANGMPLARVKTTDKGVTLTIPSADAPGFADWIDTEAEDLMRELFDRWSKARGKP